MLRIDYILCSRNFNVLSYEVIDSWGYVTQPQRGDTIVVRRFGDNKPLEGEGVKEYADEQTLALLEQDTIVDNEVNYSDHYPVMVRLLYNKTTN